jgi:Flp pilus assembly protein TadD
MSLLMDALKRAEKARQAEASSDGAELDLASTQGFSLDPIDESEAAERSAPREPTLDQAVSPADPRSDSSSGLSLENTQSVRGRLALEEDDSAGGRSLDDTGGRSLEDSISLIDDEDAVDVAHRLPQDTSATLPSIKQARQSVDNYFDGTGSASLTRDDLESAIANEATAPHQRVAGDTETQRRVRAVFHAKEASRGRRGRNWVTVALVPLLLLLIVGGAVFVFWDSISGMFVDKPLVARQAPRPTPPVVEPAPPTTVVASTSPPAATASDATSPPAAPAAASPSTSTETPVPAAGSAPPGGDSASTTSAGGSGETMTVPGTTKSSQGIDTEIAALAPTAQQATNPGDGDSAGRLSAQQKVDQRIQRDGYVPASPTGGTAFKIKRQSTPDKLHPRLVRAYDAWLSGNLAAAKRDYESVLKSEPRNRNALLGLGAIAVRNGRWDDASDHYTALLRVNPRDSIAQAGLIGVHENVDPLRGESQIKLLLREEPEAGHLHFTLGNMYAAQQRWGEAQSAYFDAYRLETNNPDYAYNLAVSLDQLGKGGAAADYYRLALELAANNGAVFDQPSVRNRLLKLAFESAAQ